MTETIYSKIFEFSLSSENLEKILALMKEKRPFDKNKELPEKFYLVYCNCSDRSLEDNPCDGYTSEFYPGIIFVDPDGRADTNSVVSHELVHILQDYKYCVFYDEFDESYKQRWFEEMAFSLEKNVLEIIKNVQFIELDVESGYIEDFLLEKFICKDFPEEMEEFN